MPFPPWGRGKGGEGGGLLMASFSFCQDPIWRTQLIELSVTFFFCFAFLIAKTKESVKVDVAKFDTEKGRKTHYY